MKRIYEFLSLLVILALLCLQHNMADDAGESSRDLEDTLIGLQKIARSSGLPFERIRDVNDAISRLQSQLQQKSLTEEEKEVARKFKELVILKAQNDERNRYNQLMAVRVLLNLGEPLEALNFFKNTQSASTDDIEWPLLALQIFLQLGDYSKAAIYASTIDKLLGKRTPLTLSTPVHVDQVQSYRLYTPYSGGDLKAGETLILYIEVNGARFKIQQQGVYSCNLQFALELRDELQNVIERQDNYGSYTPEYNGPIRDLHATIYYRIPPGLQAGDYTLIVKCADAYGQAWAESDFLFSLGGKKRIRIPQETKTAGSLREEKGSPELYLEKAKSGDFSDMIDLLDNDLDGLGNDPYNLKELSKEELDKNKLKAAEIMLERSKMQGGLLTDN